MYIASIACNVAQNHWKSPAQWMYYHLLDADWASNALSWQWVAGTNSNKKYYANQENINKFCHSNQTGTFLDVSYDDFENLPIPEVLLASEILALTTPLPEQKPIEINTALPALIYNFYNLDPIWKKELSANRILLLEPSHFKQYPVSQKTIDFIIDLSKNIENMQLYVGEFNELTTAYKFGSIYYKEHPLNKHYKGIEDKRDWIFSVRGYYPSFFAFWKKCKKEIAF
jgi:deoxyribodipyrimidine photo-lyase